MTRCVRSGPDELQQALDHQQDERPGDERAVRARVDEQPPHEPAVVAPCAPRSSSEAWGESEAAMSRM